MATKKVKKFRQERKLWYRGFKNILKIRYKKPKFIFLGDKPTTQSLILSNHVGTDAPMSLEIYAEFPIRIWGTHEMNSGLRKMYRYQTRVYYHEKKGWNLHLARLFCLLASPLTNLFYKGLKLISTYRDHRFRHTIQESKKAIKNGENIVVFPEISDDGYLDELKGFYQGFTLLAETCLKKGIDLSVYVAYFKIKEKVYLFDKPIFYSKLKQDFSNRKEICKYLVERCNSLGKMDLSNDIE
ncbi:MAG: hypothetical protein ACOX5X_01655 [Acholeplasmataceae bacterium]|jgi:hypothetical protein